MVAAGLRARTRLRQIPGELGTVTAAVVDKVTKGANAAVVECAVLHEHERALSRRFDLPDGCATWRRAASLAADNSSEVCDYSKRNHVSVDIPIPTGP